MTGVFRRGDAGYGVAGISTLLAAIALVLALAIAAPVYAAQGTWERAWGKDVVSGGAMGFEICTVAASCQAGTAGGLGGELSAPAAAATDTAGNVYVTESFNHRIQKFDSAGNFQRAWGKDVVSGGDTGFEICTAAASCKAGAPGGLGGEFNGPNGVATDPAGNVYVTDASNNRIQKFDSAGTFERTWGKDVNLTSGGNLCTAASADTCQAGATGGLGGELNAPLGLATDTAGNVYVADQSNRRIQKFDTAGTFERTWGKDVNLTSGGNLCTAASADTCQAGATGGLGGELNLPVAVATDPAGSVYVAESINQRIQKFDTAGTFQRAWGKDVVSGGGTEFEICTVAASCKAGAGAGGLGGELNFPLGLATDTAGNVYVTESFNHRIQKFDSAGTFQRVWGKDVVSGGGTGFEICTAAASCKAGAPGGLGGEFSSPHGPATDTAGNVYVADTTNERIQKFADPSPPPPPPPGPTADTSAPSADVSAKKKQKAKGPYKVKVGSDEAASAVGTGKVIAKGGTNRSLPAQAAKKKKSTFKLNKPSKGVTANAQVTLKLKVKGKKNAKKLVKLVKRGAKAKAKITVTLTDLAGNSSAETVVVKLKK